MVSLHVRPAATGDVRSMKGIIDRYAGTVMLVKESAALYRDVADFLVIEDAGEVLGCGALHVRGDLGEIGTVAVLPVARGRGVGSLLVARLLDRAIGIGLGRVFVLTFESAFFARHGFHPVAERPQPISVGCGRMGLPALDGAPLFLDLGQAKPNTLGNTRMVLGLRGSVAGAR